jgi:TrmH family RNA methyltransferase
VSREVFDRLSRRQHPDGVAAVCETPTLTLDRFHPSEPALVLVGDGIEKPGNIGAMIRTCDALGAAFLGSSLATDIVNPNVIRASQGSLFATPTASAARSDVIEWCRTNTSVFLTSPDEGMRLWDIDLTGAVSIVIGAEDDGVDPDWLGVGRGLAIPMRGAADSLNASVSAAIVLAEAARQRSD